jgi:hypothetical protein
MNTSYTNGAPAGPFTSHKGDDTPGSEDEIFESGDGKGYEEPQRDLTSPPDNQPQQIPKSAPRSPGQYHFDPSGVREQLLMEVSAQPTLNNFYTARNRQRSLA